MVVNPKVYYTWMQRMGRSTSTKFDVGHLHATAHLFELERQLLATLNVPNAYVQRRMIEGMSIYVGYLSHPASTLSMGERLRYVAAFRARFGRLAASGIVPIHQRVYTALYNRGWDRALFLVKRGVRLYKRLRYGTDVV